MMTLRLVSKGMNNFVIQSGRLCVALNVCGSGISLKFDHTAGPGKAIGKDRVSDMWLGLVSEIDWCSDPNCKDNPDEAGAEDEAAIPADYGAEVVYKVWELLERAKPAWLTRFQISWRIPFGWPRIEEFIGRINGSKYSCTVEITITGDKRKPTFESVLTFGPKFKALTVTGFGQASDFFNVAQLAAMESVDQVTFTDMFESTLEDLDRFVQPVRSVHTLQLLRTCFEMSGKQPSRPFENVGRIVLNAGHFHTATVKKYGTCLVPHLSLQASFPFQQMYDFPKLHTLEMQSYGPEDTAKFKHLLKGIHRLDLLAYSPHAIPTAKEFKQSQISHLELVMFKLADAMKQAHPRFFAPIKQLRHLSDFGLLLDFRQTDPGPILQVGNTYHSLILDFVEQLIKANNRIIDIKIGIQSNSDNCSCSFDSCDQTLVFNPQKISKLKSLYN